MKINNDKVRSQYNLLRILRATWLNHGISRIELCRQFQMDKATMSAITGHLISLGILEEVEPLNVVVKPGRKPVGLGVLADFAYVAGIEFHVQGLRAVIKNMQSRTVYDRDFLFDIKKGNIREAFMTVYRSIREELEDRRLLGIGVAVPGVVNHEEGIILKSSKMGIDQEPYYIKSEVFDSLDVPCFIDNDANCCARGVLVDHREEGFDNLLYAHIHHFEGLDLSDKGDSLGLGFGIVLNGKLYYGPDYTAGEFQTIEYDETRINQLNLTSDELDRYSRDRDLQKRVFLHLASHIALFINVFNFKDLFLGGSLPTLIPDLKTLLRDVIDKNWLYKNSRECGIHLVDHENMCPAIGSAAMFLELLFTVPEMEHSRGALIWQGIFGESLIDY